MRINKQYAKNLQPNNTTLDNILLEAKVIESNSKKYIELQTTPKMIILSDSTGSTAKIDNNPNVTSGKYDVPNTFTKAYYVPGDSITISRAVANLGIDTTLNPAASISEQVDLLNLKLTQAGKDLSVWDTYNIYKVAYNLEDLSSALASLPLSSSVLVNIDTASVSVGSWTVKKGDMICRDYLGTLHHIPGSNGGYYFPSKIQTVVLNKQGDQTTTSSVFQLGFQFSTETPKDGSAQTIVSGTDATEAYTNMSVQFPPIEAMESALCYSNTGPIAPNTDKSINFLFLDESQKIQPIVYYYVNDGEKEERVYLPVDYYPSDTSFRLANPTKLNLKYEVR